MKVGESGTSQILAWRGIFLANEFNELQTEYRYISPECTLVWLAFLLRGVGWEWVT